MARTQYVRDFKGEAPFVIPDTPIGLTIAGSDCSGGAGLQIDMKIFQRLQVYGLSVATAIVAEVPGKVVSVQAVPAVVVADQLGVIMETYPVGAAKTGMFHDAEQVGVAVKHLKAWKRRDPTAWLVVDPVMVATSGTLLLQAEAIHVLKSELLPLADLVTPNLPEAGVLLNREVNEAPIDLAKALASDLGINVLLKGGHAKGHHAVDHLVTTTGMTTFDVERLPGPTVHGTGCALSAAITAGLASGLALEEAVSKAKDVLTEAMREPFILGSVRSLRI